jgi:hypothetical protein
MADGHRCNKAQGMANLKKVDIQFPIDKAAYKAQKKNKQDMEEKKDLIEEGPYISLMMALCPPCKRGTDSKSWKMSMICLCPYFGRKALNKRTKQITGCHLGNS